MSLYDRPLFRDWLFWLTLVAMLAVLPAGSRDGGTLVIGLVFQFVLFGLVPGVIRRRLRR